MVKKIEPYKGISAIYDEIRPSYPEKLIQDVISKTGINVSDRLLEIGAGTGKATVQFAEKGFIIHAIELGKDMAEILKVKCAKYPNVTFDVASFEEWNPQNDEKYVTNYSINQGRPKRRVHLGAIKEDEKKSEIEASGLFEIVQKIEYTGEIKNNAEQYLKAKKTVPTFASILDGLDDKTIEKMYNEIEDIINSYGGYICTLLNFSLYITKKII